MQSPDVVEHHYQSAFDNTSSCVTQTRYTATDGNDRQQKPPLQKTLGITLRLMRSPLTVPPLNVVGCN
jgi:hypothetical protein